MGFSAEGHADTRQHLEGIDIEGDAALGAAMAASDSVFGRSAGFLKSEMGRECGVDHGGPGSD